MSRKPQAPEIPFARDALKLFMRGAADPIPRDPELQREIIAALLLKLEQSAPREAKRAKGYIQFMSGLEALDTDRVSSEDKKRFYRQTLVSLVRGRTKKGPHLIDAVRIQRAGLVKYFEQQQFPVASDRPQDEWIAARENEILSILVPFGCVCDYRTTLNDFHKAFRSGYDDPRLAYEEPTDGKYHLPTADAIDTILGHLHGCTRSRIRQLLKPSSAPRSEEEIG